MPRTIETTIYKFDELSDSAKETAREWWRRCEAEEFDPEFVLDDADTIAKLMGIEIARPSVPLMGGGTRYDPEIYYSGFYSQGDGACFVGSYSYAKGSVAAVKEHAPQDSELHKIAEGFAAVQKRNFYRLRATIRHTGRYSHEYATTIGVEDCENESRELGEDAESIAELLRDYMRWIFKQLREEYEYRMSDENVDESILANEYEFDEDGKRV